ncbi:ATP-binding protein [Falsiroseomonas sp. HW251]|uniref:ATP-binding protein n=1 Tax=Falsiroseomonas sp. HW251 TaxID=3390998 RepID=UPI003D31531D
MTATGPPDPEVEAAQVSAIYGQLPLAATVALANAAMLALVVSGGRPTGGLLAWLGVMVAACLVRLGLWGAHRGDRRAPEQPGRWARAAMAAAAFAGAAWGVGAALLWPDSETQQLFWVFVVGGMCTGAVALHHARPDAVLAFILPAGLPIALRYAMEGTSQSIAAAAMILVFLAALAAAARRFAQQFATFARMRRDLHRQSHELAEARAELRREAEEHRATAESLHQAQKMEALGQLTGGIAHDFNNLLTAVMGSLALLRRRLPPDDAKALRLLDNAAAGGRRGAALTQRLLAFSRRQVLRPEAVDVGTLLEGMAELLRRSAGPPYRVVLEVPPSLPPALADPVQLELALLNLVLNARDAMPEPGEIRVAARAEEATAVPGLAPGTYVVLAVIDHGTGMDAATLARAAEPFFTTKGPGKGTGLGLSMVYGLAAQSQGRLVLKSRPGQGTTAELWLRRAEPAAPAVERAVPAPAAPSRRLQVLLVDDDPLVLASTAGMLEELGHAVVEADGGRPALESLESGLAVDLVVTDYGMPGMSGIELTEAVRRLRPGLPVILATGYDELPAAAPRDVTPLSKPFGQDGLGAAIEETLARAH